MQVPEHGAKLGDNNCPVSQLTLPRLFCGTLCTLQVTNQLLLFLKNKGWHLRLFVIYQIAENFINNFTTLQTVLQFENCKIVCLPLQSGQASELQPTTPAMVGKEGKHAVTKCVCVLGEHG